MNKPLPDTDTRDSTDDAQDPLAAEYARADRHATSAVRNRSGIADQAAVHAARLERRRATTPTSAIPGQPPYTRGIYATMHRGRTWTQRQLIGLGTPPDYNARLRDILGQGATAVSLIPCNSVYPRLRHGRGATPSSSAPAASSSTPPTTWTPASTAWTSRDVVRDERSVAVHAARVHAGDREAPRRRLARDQRHVEPERLPVALRRQPHVLPHRAAGRAADPRSTTSRGATGTCRAGIRCRSSASTCSRPARRRPRRWRSRSPPRSSTPTTASPRGMSPDQFLPRFTFFFDISLSFFEEIAQVPRRPPHLGAARARALRRARSALVALQVPRADLGRRSHARSSRSTTSRASPSQAMAGIFGGLQSLHTDAYDEALSCPTQFGARIAVATQNILREEAHLTDVIDPLGGSYYVETLTDEMEAAILALDARGRGRGRHVPRRRAGHRAAAASASRRARFQDARRERRADGRRRQRATRSTRTASARPALPKPDAQKMRRAPRRASRAWKAQRSQAARRRARWTRSPAPRNDRRDNVFAQVVAAAEAGCTHGEICGDAAPRDGLRPRAGAGLRHRRRCRRGATPLRSRRRPRFAPATARRSRARSARSRTARPRGRRALPRAAGAASSAARTSSASPGAPGAGKSTLINALLRRASRARPARRRRRGRSVEPDHRRRGARRSRPHGRARRARARLHPLARLARPSRAGCRARPRGVVDVLDAAGFDTVIVETVGAGQSDVEIATLADTQRRRLPAGTRRRRAGDQGRHPRDRRRAGREQGRPAGRRGDGARPEGHAAACVAPARRRCPCSRPRRPRRRDRGGRRRRARARVERRTRPPPEGNTCHRRQRRTPPPWT